MPELTPVHDDAMVVAENLSACFFADKLRYAAPTPILTRVIRGRRTPGPEQEDDADDDDDDESGDDDGFTDAGDPHEVDTPVTATVRALRDVSFQVRRGQAVALIGDTGAGKTALLRVLAGNTRATGGHALLHGYPSPLARVAAQFMQPDFSPARNAVLGAGVSRTSRRRMRRHLDQVLELAGVTAHERHSGFTRAPLDIAIATALAGDYDVLLLDDAFSRIEGAFRERCLELVERRRSSGATIILEAADPSILRRICTHALWLDAGRAVAFGELDEVLDGYEKHVRQRQSGSTEGGLAEATQANDRAAIVTASGESEGSGLASFEVILHVTGSSVIAEIGIVLRDAHRDVLLLEHPTPVKCLIGSHRFRVSAAEVPDGRYAGHARVRLRDGSWKSELRSQQAFLLTMGDAESEDLTPPTDVQDDGRWRSHPGDWEYEALVD